MKRSPLKRGTKQLKRSGFKRKALDPSKRLVRASLRQMGKSPSSVLKRAIQSLLREVVTKRDGGCVLREYPEAGRCSGPLQAEHLISRQFSKTYADLRNIVCLCQYHHIFWKPQHSRLYWEIIEGEIGPERWDFIKFAEKDKHAYPMDWKLEKLALEQELKKVDKLLAESEKVI